MYEFTYFNEVMKENISFRKLDYNFDLKLLHNWMNSKHVSPFWNLNLPLNEFKNHLSAALNDKHQTLYIGCIGKVSMSYWESYWAKDDIISEYYDYDSNDQGIHLLIGNKEFLGKGFALELLKAMCIFQFQHKQTLRIIAEPDIRNKKMIHIFKKCGFEPIQNITLPDKEGLLMMCYREVFERKWCNNVLPSTKRKGL